MDWSSGRSNAGRPLARRGPRNLLLALGFAMLAGTAVAAPSSAEGSDPSESESLSEIGAKLSNPVSDMWALFTEIDLTFSDGDASNASPEDGQLLLFQPILPIPLTENWKLLARPTVPFIMQTPFPDGLGGVEKEGGIGDILLPLLFSPKLENWILGLGPSFTFPSSTDDLFGRQQWAIGPTAILGYKTKDWMLGAFPQYFFGVASRGNDQSKPDASYMALVYFAWLNLPDAWQVGFNPTINYDNTKSSGNRWNVPIGIAATKTIRIGSLPVKFELAVEYSVVSEDDYGKRAMFRFIAIPVIPALIGSPIFGGS